jgi:RNase P/RNase MRP subunit POP5
MAKEKLKILKPTMREKKYYLVVNSGFNDVEKAVLKYLGVFGLAKSGLIFVASNNGKCVFAADRKMVNCIKSAVSFSGLKCLYVSGVVHKAKEKIGIKN